MQREYFGALFLQPHGDDDNQKAQTAEYTRFQAPIFRKNITVPVQTGLLYNQDYR